MCRAAREGAKEHLRSLPGLVVVYSKGVTATGTVSEVWRLDVVWKSMPALVTARVAHGCCAVRGSVAVIAGRVLVGNEVTTTTSVEVLVPLREGGTFVSLPPLSYGGIYGTAAITVEENDSTAGQVLLLGGSDSSHQSLSTVQLGDLATGECTPQLHLLRSRVYPVAARLPDGRVGCTGGIRGGVSSSAEIWGPPEQGAQDAAWTCTP